MRLLDPEYKIELDIDRDRIKTIVSEAYVHCKEILGAEFEPLPGFLQKMEPYLSSNRISTSITLELPSRKCPDLRLEVDIRRKSVFARTHMKSKQVLLNRYLTQL